MNPITLLALFGAGLLSFAAPCVVPLVPAYLAMMTDPSIHRSPVRPTLTFVTAFGAEFVLFGALAGLLGHALTPIQTWTQRVGGIAIALFGLALLGAFDSLRTDRHLLLRLPRPGSWQRPIVMGVAFGAAWTPCAGPLLGAALTVAARSSSAIKGAALLATYAAGIGAPFVAASLTIGILPAMPAAVARRSGALTVFAGALLVVFGALLTVGRYGWLTDPVAARWT